MTVRLALIEPGPALAPRASAAGSLERSSRRARFAGEWRETEVLRGEPGAGTEAEGPCVFELPRRPSCSRRAGERVDDAGTIAAERSGR